MKKCFVLVFILLTGCGLFSSEDLHNDTQKETVETFLKASFAGDKDLVKGLSIVYLDFITRTDEEKLDNATLEACDIREVVNLNYEAVCENLDGNDVYMTFTLEEEKNKFYIKDAVMDSEVHVVFRQDAPELTKSFVNKVENMIGDDLYKLDG